MDATKGRVSVGNNRVAGPGLEIIVRHRCAQNTKTIYFSCWSNQVRRVERLKIFALEYWTNEASFLIKRGAELFPTHRLNQKFHACLHAGFTFTVAIKQSQSSGSKIEQLSRRKEIGVQIGQVWSSA